MKKILINFPSVTFAIKCKKIFIENGIPSYIIKTPSNLSSRGCGYSISINHTHEDLAKSLLKRYSITYNDISTLKE